jgi:hypothetical protein
MRITYKFLLIGAICLIALAASLVFALVRGG